MSFDPNSSNAMFATILSKIEKLEETCGRIETQTTATNGRVTKLEQQKNYERGVFAAIAVGVSAIWSVGQVAWGYLTHK
jgi:hypothetical protein